MVADVLSRVHNDHMSQEMIAVIKATKTDVLPSNLQVDLAQIAMYQQKDPELQEMIQEAQSKEVSDPTRIHYVMQNGFLFRSLPKGHQGQKLQLMVPSSQREAFLHYAQDNPLSGHLGRLKTLLYKWIPEFRYALNTAWHESTGFTPAEVALGRKLKGPIERAIHKPPDPDDPTYSLINRQQQLINLVRANVGRAQENRKGIMINAVNQFSFGWEMWFGSGPILFPQLMKGIWLSWQRNGRVLPKW